MAGYSIGGLIFPPLVQVIFDEFRFRGAFLILGAIILNSAAGAILQRIPPEPLPTASLKPDKSCQVENYKKKPKQGTTHLREDCEQTCFKSGVDLQVHEEKFPENEDFRYDGKSNCFTEIERENCFVGNVIGGVPKKFEDDSSCGYHSLKASQNELAGSCHEDTPGATSEDRLFLFLTLPKFYLIVFTQVQVFVNMANYTTVIVDFGTDRGLPRWNAVSLVSTYTIVDLLSRVSTGWITDKGYLSTSTWSGLSFLAWSLSFLLIPVFDSYQSQVMLSAVAGWSNGCTLPLIPVLFMEIVDISKYSVCFGCGSFVVGLTGLVRPFLIGHFRDTQGDYQGLFFLTGGATMILSLLWLCASLQERCTRLRKADERVTGALFRRAFKRRN